LNTPSGRPARCSSSAISRLGDGSRSLQDERVAAGDRHGEHPARHHEREVERRDAGDHAQRLAHRPVVDAGGHLVGVVTLEQLRDAAGELDDVDAAHHLALCVREHLAVLGGDHRRELVAMLVEQAEELVEHAGAADRRRVGPAVEGLLRGGDGRLDIGHAAQVQLARDGAGGRVEDRLLARVRLHGVLAADEMADRGGGGEGGRGHVGLLASVVLQLASLGIRPPRGKTAGLDSLFV
jgi:CBS domain-containing protein